MSDLYQTVQELDERTCTKNMCSNIQVAVDKIDTVLVAVNQNIKDLEEAACSKETCNRKAEKNDMDTNVKSLYQTIEELTADACTWETCSSISGEVDLINGCMEDPKSESCHDKYAVSNSIPITVTSLAECIRLV